MAVAMPPTMTYRITSVFRSEDVMTLFISSLISIVLYSNEVTQKRQRNPIPMVCDLSFYSVPLRISMKIIDFGTNIMKRSNILFNFVKYFYIFPNKKK